MSSTSQLGYQVLWCAHPALESALALLMWRRKLNKQFPVFFTYILSQIAIFTITFPLWHIGNYEWYFWAYWIGAAVSAVLGFKVIHEVFLDVFRSYHSLKDLGTIVFRWAGTVMLMVSAVVAFASSPKYGLIVHAVTTLQASVRFVQFGLVVFLLPFSRFLGVSKRQHSFGIAFGFGLFATMELVLLALNSGGLLHQDSLNLIDMTMFNVSVLVWLGYCFAPDPARELPANHFQTERWEESLADIQHPQVPDSLIPMFEGMVERALSRTGNTVQASEKAGRAGSAPATRGISAAAGAGGSVRS